MNTLTINNIVFDHQTSTDILIILICILIVLSGAIMNKDKFYKMIDIKLILFL